MTININFLLMIMEVEISDPLSETIDEVHSPRF